MLFIIEMFKLKSKRGMGHFEMIMSFIFFIGFVFFMFLFISPWDNSALPNSALNRLYGEFSEQVKVPLSSVFVKANYTGLATCFSIDLPTEIFKYAITDGSSFVTLLDGTRISSGLIGQDLNLRGNENFFRVAISPEFIDEGVSSCDVLNYFELGGVVELEIVSYSKLVAMRDKYFNDYSELKKDLNVADIFDFAIIPEDMGEVKMEPVGGIPDSVNVLARDYIVEVLKSDGSISNERIGMLIW